MSDHAIDTMLLEERRYPPPFTSLYEWEPPYAKWYLGGTLNVCFNCVDRYVEAGNGDKTAYFWEGETPNEDGKVDQREITYAGLQRDVVRFANALKKIGVTKGTPVAIYMGMVPELPVAMLACTRLGAPHTVVFGGFSADSLSGRMVDMECDVLITQDEAWRRGATVPLKRTADEAMSDAPKIRASVVLRRTGNDAPMQDGRDHWWHELEDGVSDDAESCPCEPMESEDLLFLIPLGDTTTLADPAVVSEIQSRAESEQPDDS
jgi:acetyl-CoA synthetase